MEGNCSTVRGALLPFCGADACILLGNCALEVISPPRGFGEHLTSPSGLLVQLDVNEIVADEIKGFLFFNKSLETC